jgi:cobalt/nickel transport system ATP-binding protein
MAGLDHAMRRNCWPCSTNCTQRGITLLMATHDIDFAYRWAERIHLMAAGRCTASLNAAELGEHAAALAALGLPLPEVITLHRELVGRGILPANPPPRCTASLLSMLAEAKITEETTCKIA